LEGETVSELTCKQVYTVGRGEIRQVAVDLGENTAGIETGVLKAGDTVASGTIAVVDSPTGSTAPTLSAVTVNSSGLYVGGRLCSAGEAVAFTLTLGASQVYGRYVLLLTVVTTNGETIKRRLAIDVGAE
jgi:hypothetical protein